jgi:hypothetical protein
VDAVSSGADVGGRFDSGSDLAAGPLPRRHHVSHVDLAAEPLPRRRHVSHVDLVAEPLPRRRHASHVDLVAVPLPRRRRHKVVLLHGRDLSGRCVSRCSSLQPRASTKRPVATESARCNRVGASGTPGALGAAREGAPWAMQQYSRGTRRVPYGDLRGYSGSEYSSGYSLTGTTHAPASPRAAAPTGHRRAAALGTAQRVLTVGLRPTRAV